MVYYFFRHYKNIKLIVQTIGENFGAEEPVQQAAPPLDSELQFNPVANSSPANQNHNQFKIQRKRGIY